MLIRGLIILLIVAAILGGSGYFIYELYYKDKKLDEVEAVAPKQAQPTPTPDPSLAAFEALKPLISKDTPEAREALMTFVTNSPDSPKISEARAALSRINLAILRDLSSSGNTRYVVKKGDSLAKIGSQFKSSPELICWFNQLPNINLQIGQELVVPSFNGAIVIDRAKSMVTLLNYGEFFAEIPIVSAKYPATLAKGDIESKVVDRVARKGDKRIPFGDKEYPHTERLILLGAGGLTIRPLADAPTESATPAASPAASASPAPSASPTTTPVAPTGIVLNPQDFTEIYVLLKTGSPVTIK
jgi:LysM repeat protein